jgi:hypothetical protein
MNDTEEKIDVVVPEEGAPEIKDETVVEIQDELPFDDVQKTDEEESDVQKELKKLKKKLEKEKEARKQAEESARQATQKLNSAYEKVENSDLQLVSTAIETVKRENEYLKYSYKEALQVGDYDKVAELQEAMSGNAAKLLQLENGKVALESKPRQVASDPVEQFASQLSPRSADWVRRNPQCVTDPRLQQKMIAAHNLAIADGYSADTDDYFSFVEQTIGLKKAKREEARDEEDTPLSSASKPVQRQAAPPAAPANQGGTTRSNVVRLTRAEADTAKMFGMTEQEYAKHKIALQKEGKL